MTAAQTATPLEPQSSPTEPRALDELGLLAEVLGARSAVKLVESLRGLRDITLAGDVELRAAGLSRKAIARLRAVVGLGLRLNAARERGRRLGDGRAVGCYFGARLCLSDVEEFWAVALDVRHRVIGEFMVARGTLTGVEVHPREVFRELIRTGAAAALFCHNHPSGDPTPSRQDLELTARLREVGEMCGITVLDHVVVAAGGLYSSIAERGWL